MIRSVLVVINPISGYARSRELPVQLNRRLRHMGLEAHIHLTTGPGDAHAFTLQHVRRYDAVIAAGGDGTVRDVLSAASCEGVPATIFPSGTENLFAKQLGITRDIDRVVATLRHGKRITADMGEANGRRFMLLSGVGFDADVLIHLGKTRTGHITHMSYFWPLWRTYWEYGFPRVTVEADGERLVTECPALVFVGNIRRYAIGLNVCCRADHRDGLLDVCIFRCDHPVPLIAHAWRTIWRTHTEHRDVIYRQAKTIHVRSSKAVAYETDGDPAGVLPVTYQVLPGAATLLVPTEEMEQCVESFND